MKRFLRLVTACMLFAVTALGFTACTIGGKYSTVTVTVSYLTKSNGTYSETDTEDFSLKLYKHLAPNTTARIEELAKADFFKNAAFYKNSKYSQVMFGDLYFENGVFTEKAPYGNLEVENGDAEFEKGGVTGSDLVAELGTLGMWRNIDRNSKLSYTSSATFDNGSNTIFMPTSTNASYNGYFAIFGKLNADGLEYMDKLAELFTDSDEYTKYIVYSKAERDLTQATVAPKKYTSGDMTYYIDGEAFNILSETEFEKLKDDMDDAVAGSSALLVNQQTYYIPNVIMVVKSVKVK